MIENRFPTIQLPLTIEQFEQLPRNPAYKYEYFDGQVWLTPRPKTYRALLDLPSFTPPIASPATDEEVLIRRLTGGDWDHLPQLFAGAFGGVQPWASLGDEASRQSAEESLQRTREGEEGPLIGEACFVALRRSDEARIGVLLTTLTPGGDVAQFGSCRWETPPPADAVARRMGRPHLTWIFVSPWYGRLGVGTSLLAAAVAALRSLGYTELVSTFLLGNESSTLWHWRMGFRLQSYPGSMRAVRENRRREFTNQEGAGEDQDSHG